MFIKRINTYFFDNFDNIRKNLNIESQERYYQKWIQKYDRIFKANNSFEIIDLKIRECKAIKEMYAASILFCEAQKNYKYKCESSFFYALYYSLFHAQLGCVCYETGVSLQELNKIGHKKIGAQFKRTFCEGKDLISNTNIPENFETLRKLREYYSYTLPINSFRFDKETINTTQSQIKECFQITNLHSLFLEKSYDKVPSILKINSEETLHYLIENFKDTMTRPLLNENNMDPADKNTLDEIVKYGIDFNYISLLLDHTFDEFRTYSIFNDMQQNDEVTNEEIYSFIYNCIM